MRRTLALFSIAALLVVLLAGCGQKTSSSTGGSGTGDTGSTGGTANGSGSMTGSSVTGSAIGGVTGRNNFGSMSGMDTNNAMSRRGGTMKDDQATDGSRSTNASANAQLRGSSDSMTGTVATPGTMLDSDEQYRRMLANAHVHDTDGYLLDGENAQYVTW